MSIDYGRIALTVVEQNPNVLITQAAPDPQPISAMVQPTMPSVSREPTEPEREATYTLGGK